MIRVMDADMNSLRQLQASVLSLSEVQSKRPYISIRLRLCSTKPNVNGEAVNEAFIDKVVNDKNAHLALPLVADVQKINRGDYRDGLGHMFDPETQTFLSTQIGGFVDFEKVNDEYGVSLIGEARVYKRNKKVTEALLNLYRENNLSFSFEIIAGAVTVEDGIMTVGDSDKNQIIGMALVSRPAYAEAVALSLVAEEKEDSKKRYAAAMEHAHINLDGVKVAEANLQTIEMWIYDAVYKYVREKHDCFWFRFYHIGANSAILYREDSGHLYRVDYVVREQDVYVTDMYQVETVRVSENADASQESEEQEVKDIDMNKAETVEIVETVEVAEVDAIEVEAEVTEAVETAEPVAQEEAVVASVEDLEAKIATQAARIAELEEIEAKWLAAQEAEKQAAIASKRSKMIDYAKASGLDTESEVVTSALENLDYERLMTLVLEAGKEEEEEQPAITIAETVVNPLVEDMKLSGHWLFEKN